LKDFDPSLFPDIADAIGLSSPAFIEKDYYAVQLLKTVSELKSPLGEFVFAGGTCLAKAHIPTYRMSEDLDLKFIPNEEFNIPNDSQKRKFRSELGKIISKMIENDMLFKVENTGALSEGKYRYYAISYPKSYTHSSLRPELKLEFTETLQHAPHKKSSISSIYSTILKQDAEIPFIMCDQIEMILVEKFISLLRRTAEIDRGCSDRDDETLVRHVYDLSLIMSQQIDFDIVKNLFFQIVKQDVAQYGTRHKQFKDNHIIELGYGLQLLNTDIKHKDRYAKFLGPLVFNKKPPSWSEGIEVLRLVADRLL
jgi:predicted nucleotidyltransferase component of viral defense system